MKRLNARPQKKKLQQPRYLAVIMALCDEHLLPWPTPEHQFAPPRRWRFDYAWQDQRVALEVQGGVWTRGRHARGSGLVKEHEKLNRAAALGYRVLFCTPQNLSQMGDVLKEALKGAA